MSSDEVIWPKREPWPNSESALPDALLPALPDPHAANAFGVLSPRAVAPDPADVPSAVSLWLGKLEGADGERSRWADQVDDDGNLHV